MSGLHSAPSSVADQSDATTRTSAGSSAGGFLDPSSWRGLARSVDADDFAQHWLSLQCAALEHVAAAVVVLKMPRSDRMEPAASWPVGMSASGGLQALCDTAIREKRGIIKRESKDEIVPVWGVAYPITIDSGVYGVVSLHIEGAKEAELPGVMRQLQWGCAWLEAFVRRKHFSSSTQLAGVLQTLAIALEHARFQAAATAVATELANALKCERISIGMQTRRGMRVAALSHSAEFGEKSNLVRLLGTAMEEAADQQAILVYPAPDPDSHVVLYAHEALAKQHGSTTICTVPMVEAGELVGAITLERSGRGFERHEVEQLEHSAALLGPVLNAKWIEDQWVAVKVWRSALAVAHKLCGPRQFGLKLATAGLGALIIALGFIDGQYRVTADAALEGIVQRAVTAPISGYISESHARAGDIVAEGQILAALDKRDFELERVRWVSEKEKYLREYSRALAEGDRGRVSVLSAQVDQADAQIQLLDDQLARTQIAAPFAGMVVTGDLSQRLSAPIERGDLLFEVAPLDGYRVILRVDERDVTAVQVGQAGRLALAGMPNTLLSIEVEKLTPVSVAGEGQNYFEVEARLLDANDLLRPGMEGVAKLEIGERRLGWIYTHKLVDWLRVTAWTLLP